MKVECDCTNKRTVVQLLIAYEKVLQDALAVVWQKERELATTSLEFDYLHLKSQCKMMIGGMTLVMMSLPSEHAFTCFSFFVYIWAHFSFTLIGGNLTAQLRFDKDIIKLMPKSRT